MQPSPPGGHGPVGGTVGDHGHQIAKRLDRLVVVVGQVRTDQAAAVRRMAGLAVGFVDRLPDGQPLAVLRLHVLDQRRFIRLQFPDLREPQPQVFGLGSVVGFHDGPAVGTQQRTDLEEHVVDHAEDHGAEQDQVQPQGDGVVELPDAVEFVVHQAVFFVGRHGLRSSSSFHKLACSSISRFGRVHVQITMPTKAPKNNTIEMTANGAMPSRLISPSITRM
jgi:hypothetical protein